MKYFEIRNSINPKVVGTFPQVEKAIHNCSVGNNPNFIDNFSYIKIDDEPITSNAILKKNAIITDLISASIMGFSLKLLISDKFKSIIQKYSGQKCQFFQAPIIYQDKYYYNYWIMHPYKINIDYIDFEKSTFAVRRKKQGGGTLLENIEVSTIENFQKILKNKKELNYTYFFSERISIKSNTKDNFFILRYVEGGIKYVVSEKLKKEIEINNCTGIEFMPLELKLSEWLQKK